MEIEESYNRLAHEYADQFSDELAHAPFDRALLEVYASEVKGRVVDLGCGPGQVASFLHRRGVHVSGLDLCEEMIKEARARWPGIDFQQGSILDLPFESESRGGLTAFYAIVHFQDAEVARAFQEMYRVLQPGGYALISYHIGDQVLERDEQLDQDVELPFVLHPREVIKERLLEAGFQVRIDLERAPHEHEEATRRGYVWVEKPLGTEEGSPMVL